MILRNECVLDLEIILNGDDISLKSKNVSRLEDICLYTTTM